MLPQPPLPPEKLRFMGRSDEEFLKVGDEVVSTIQDLSGFNLDASVLDIGCGYGRVAHALLRRGHSGAYLGVDILKPHIEWCQRHLTPFTGGRYQFRHLDVINDRYNPAGSCHPADVSLGDGTCTDFALAASVFTHMYGDGVVHYLAEMAKAVRPGGTAMATFFLINNSQRDLELKGMSRYPLSTTVDPVSRTWNPDDPLHVIAFEETWVLRQAEEAGFAIDAVHLGSWCGREGAPVYQDTIILTRR